MSLLRRFVVLSFIFSLLLVNPAIVATADYGHSHLEAKYVPWGIDEYELFALTQPELLQKFKNKLEFDKDFSHARFDHDSTSGPQFLLTITDGHVTGVQRMFIDGGGCHIMGPVLTSKKEALQFSIDGLSHSSTRDQQDNDRLASARKLLREITSQSSPARR
jgi:hypothetical protein